MIAVDPIVIRRDHLTRLEDTLRSIQREDLDSVVCAVKKCRGIVWLFGNGGSYSNAQHWSCDLLKVAGLRTAVLGGNTPLLTALSNDLRYEDAVAEEFGRLAQKGDILIVLSCSGYSPNITRLLMKARELSIPSVLFTGSINTTIAQADITVRIKSENYGIIEDCHAAIGHYLTQQLCHA